MLVLSSAPSCVCSQLWVLSTCSLNKWNDDWVASCSKPSMLALFVALCVFDLFGPCALNAHSAFNLKCFFDVIVMVSSILANLICSCHSDFVVTRHRTNFIAIYWCCLCCMCLWWLCFLWCQSTLISFSWVSEMKCQTFLQSVVQSLCWCPMNPRKTVQSWLSPWTRVQWWCKHKYYTVQIFNPSFSPNCLFILQNFQNCE